VSNRIAILKDRAQMLAKTRAFFSARNVTEVDCPIVSASASVDAHIDLIPVEDVTSRRYLHSSPEYGMKRLLSEGIGDIYQLSHVFRLGEKGRRHNPEFMMSEWYRIGFSFEEMIQETLEYIEMFVGEQPHEYLSYREALQKFVGIDYVPMTVQDLVAFCREREVLLYDEIVSEGKDALLNVILAKFVEPNLGKDRLTVLMHYPATQCALAKVIRKGDEDVAERFEVYYRGVELANGYHELTDAEDQRHRFEEANEQRVLLGKKKLPPDENFLSALEVGLPDCCGVAVGFDRLMMLKHGVEDIDTVLPFDWDRA